MWKKTLTDYVEDADVSKLCGCAPQHPVRSPKFSKSYTYIHTQSPYTKPANSHALGASLRPQQVENFDLTPAHTCGPISHAWLKNMSCCPLAWHNFQKYFNSDPCKERKPCVKWRNDNTFHAISDFLSEKHWERARVYTRPKTGTGTSEVFGRLRKFFGNLRKWSCRLHKSQHSHDKNLMPISQKKLAGIIYQWNLL